MVQHCTYIKSPCQKEGQKNVRKRNKISGPQPGKFSAGTLSFPRCFPVPQPLFWPGTLFQVMAQVAGAWVKKECCEEKINKSQLCSSDMRGWEVAFLSYGPCYCESWALQYLSAPLLIRSPTWHDSREIRIQGLSSPWAPEKCRQADLHVSCSAVV